MDPVTDFVRGLLGDDQRELLRAVEEGERVVEAGGQYLDLKDSDPVVVALCIEVLRLREELDRLRSRVDKG